MSALSDKIRFADSDIHIMSQFKRDPKIFDLEKVDKQLSQLSGLLDCEDPEQRAIAVCSIFIRDKEKIERLLKVGKKGSKPTKTDFLQIYKTLNKPSKEQSVIANDPQASSSTTLDLASRLWMNCSKAV